MNEVSEAKTLTRNSMIEKLKSRIESKGIAVKVTSETDSEDEAPYSIERALAMESKRAMESKKVDILDSYLKTNPLYAVAKVDGGVLGGRLDQVMEEISRMKPSSVAFTIVTTDEKAARRALASSQQESAKDMVECGNCGEEYNDDDTRVWSIGRREVFCCPTCAEKFEIDYPRQEVL